MKATLKIFIILTSMISYAGINFTIGQPSRFGLERFINNGDTLNYRLLYPDYDTFQKYPLVIFLHGSGERGTDNEAQLKWGVMNFASDKMMIAHPAIVIAPQCPPNMSWDNITENRSTREIHIKTSPSKSMVLTIALIQQLIKTMPIDTNRIYITGLSMGGYGTYDAIERYPHLFAAAVPVCGAGDISKASVIAHIPIWVFHGAEDPAVSPIYSSDMVIALQKAGSRPGFTLYPGVGHFSWLAAYSDASMFDWLFKQHK
ncbi:MAG: prolyl oligopeptidase family serine peptidase [Ferruginibacter sp.]